MSEYSVRPMPGAGWYEVAKFNGGKGPEVVYDVNNDDCTCPARYRCKHTELVKVFREMGAPPMTTFWQEGNQLLWHTLLMEPLPQPRRKKRK